eukprot:Gregarina_sp_Poly_1__10045@NODE_674_length_6834_cov_113_052608_g508_i0_p4_GENE_NODE_674_length_6834_cov_113_052608_g508_i0NODE_674_length_6834_cov_113_052608_g508_i0_p4_ORF_typecomplete_len312_score56_04Coatomer_E/PF04733_14/9_2e18TPR_15/PF13429_6/0_00079HrpB1_HrpK/PF09613_10/3e03HrpB1_HrpK/PF09613_10/2_9e03HrpB1_HrpK/PF09613_10/20HrpB1_HrpK/PF09613_10/4_7HrpB1_HrpK/PF09613_10/1_3e02BTAD/PF03704_17/0_014TPR_MalT/PF17874_1/5_3e03TPR_MalT/PF17874_1/0_044TPR_5/PF12688_7/6_7e03TPR_5/PF12688_7/0_067H
MEASLIEVRDAYSCGLFGKASSALNDIKRSAGFAKSDALLCRDVNLLSLQCQLAASRSKWTSALDTESSVSEQAVYHAAVCMSPATSPEQKMASATWMKGQNPSTLDPYIKALRAFTLGVLSPAGEPVADSSGLGSVNAAISAIMASECAEATAFEVILFMVADRFDLALQVHTRMLMSGDDSVVPQLMQSWMAILKGNWEEAFLSVQDVESFLGTDTVETNNSWRLSLLRGLTRLHGGHFEEALNWVQMAADKSDHKESSVLITLIAALQNVGRHTEAAVATEKLRDVLHVSDPYWAPLEELASIAAKFE